MAPFFTLHLCENCIKLHHHWFWMQDLVKLQSILLNFLPHHIKEDVWELGGVLLNFLVPLHIRPTEQLITCCLTSCGRSSTCGEFFLALLLCCMSHSKCSIPPFAVTSTAISRGWGAFSITSWPVCIFTSFHLAPCPLLLSSHSIWNTFLVSTENFKLKTHYVHLSWAGQMQNLLKQYKKGYWKNELTSASVKCLCRVNQG